LVSASDTTGAEIAWACYWPFGGMRQQSGSFPTDRRFTGQIRDLGNDGFYFFRARHDDAGVARFFQPDPAPPAWKNALTINPYAYALNSPLRYADPSGHRTEAQIEGYLQQLYGKEWQQYLASWRANANWWGALTAVQPGDFLVSGRQIEQLLGGGG
jgi:RHS repeat-associated protein